MQYDGSWLECYIPNGGTLSAFTGSYAWRALLPMEIAAKAMGDKYARNAQMFLGLYTHVFTLPLKRGSMMQMVCPSSKSAWLQANGSWRLIKTTYSERLMVGSNRYGVCSR